jgi:hypothetical protein
MFSLGVNRSWCHFPPFLCAFSLSPGREVFVKDVDGSAVVLLRRWNRRGAQVDLVTSPSPLKEGILPQVLEQIRILNDGGPTRILWVDESDHCSLSGQGFQVTLKEEEYIFNPSTVINAEGSGYRDLRKRLRRFRREYCVQFREMHEADISGGQELLRLWRSKQGRRHPFLLDWGYTKKALEEFHKWPEEYLKAWCVTLKGRMVAFAMAGPIHKDLANFFVAKSDPEIPGLSEFLRHEVFQRLGKYPLVNDAGDLGLPGLRQYKMKFRPVSKRPVYQASSQELP